MATITLLKRKKGEAYLIRFVHPKTKRYVRRVVYCTRREAEQIRKKIDADIALGKFNIESDDTHGCFWSQLQRKYIQYAKRNKQERSVQRDQDVFKAFNKYLDGTDPPLAEISATTIETFKEVRLEGGVKPASVALELRHLRAVFYQGVKWGMIDTNPVVGVKHPKKEQNKVRYLLQDEIQRLLQVMDDAGDIEFKRLTLVYLHTGARRVEVLAPNLSWADVDFSKRQIRIHGKGSRDRYVPMNATLLKIFQELQKDGREVPFSFHPDWVSHRIADYYKRAGIGGANLHSLRKTFGSLLLQYHKADLYTVSKLLGHESVRTSEKFYLDLLDENYRDSVAGLDELIPSYEIGH